MRYFLLFTFFAISKFGYSNQTSSKIYSDLQKLHSLDRILYIAAHPDDENTRALAWFSLQQKAETAYLSLTRGDGGQNLIGDELGSDLGMLRTQELLAARSYDGANQFFTRAVDFGYSKSASESLIFWGNDDILSDVVLSIRKFKPQIIITRFPPDKRAGHGHHTASALLAIEAFDKAADPDYMPNQVKTHGTWQATSLYWNTSVWWDQSIADSAKNNPDYFVQDIGTYDNLLGQSYNEIGTIARSQHKCQGFGAILERGERLEYFKHLKGTKIKSDFFENNNNSWTNLLGKKIEKSFNKVLANFDFKKPENNVADLLKIANALNTLPDSYFKREKVNRCNQVIFECLGLHLEMTVDDFAFNKNESINITLNALNRSNQEIEISGLDEKLPFNKIASTKINYKTSNELTNPYWLVKEFDKLFYADENNIGRPENLPISYPITLKINGENIKYNLPIIYKWRDPSYGERKRNLIVTPDFSVNFEQSIALSKTNSQQKIRIKIHSFKDNLSDKITLNLPTGWMSSQNSFDLKMDKKHSEKWIEFELKTSEFARSGNLVLTNQSNDTIYSYNEIVYDHIPTQTIFKKSILKCVIIDAKVVLGKVAYITAVDDKMPASIEQLGYNVDVYKVSELSNITFSDYKSVVIGIRAYDIHPELHNFDLNLKKYVENGGNLIMQYNTASRSNPDKKYGPVPFEISRKRVTNEKSKITFLAPNHQLMQFPNKITQSDFNSWIQERGLYFADNWDKTYTPILSWEDEGEKDLQGALIVTQLGKGQFIYTGISFFRELPAGVEGAYRLMANMLSFTPETK
jgi:LmbE family N-acetylglucosaminyl deacetylase